MSDPVRVVWDALEEHDCAPAGGAGKFTARCPAHDDSDPSLSVAEGDDRRALIHCHAGCDIADVLAALGLTWRSLFVPATEDLWTHTRGTRPRPRYRPRRPVDVVLDALDAAGVAYRGMWVADGCPRCGAQALRITAGRDGALELSCVEGCAHADVMASLNAIGDGHTTTGVVDTRHLIERARNE